MCDFGECRKPTKHLPHYCFPDDNTQTLRNTGHNPQSALSDNHVSGPNQTNSQVSPHPRCRNRYCYTTCDACIDNILRCGYSITWEPNLLYLEEANWIWKNGTVPQKRSTKYSLHICTTLRECFKNTALQMHGWLKAAIRSNGIWNFIYKTFIADPYCVGWCFMRQELQR